MPDRDDSLLGWAKRYAGSFGFAVFPCHSASNGVCSCGDRECSKSAGKHPRTMHGVKDATKDIAQIERWWRQWPSANIGIATGAVSGIVVLDSDPRHGGEESVEQLVELHGKFPETPEVISGSLGKHWYYRLPDGVSIHRTCDVLPGFDILGDDGYVIAPPSVHLSSREYAWEMSSSIEDVPLVNVPPWVLPLVAEKARKTKTGSTTGATKELPNKLLEGSRNKALTSLAGTLRRRGATEEEIVGILSIVNETRCEPVLAASEVANIARSVSRYKPASELPTELVNMPLDDVAALACARIDDGLKEKTASEVLAVIEADVELRFSLAVLRTVNLSKFTLWHANLRPKDLARRVEQVLRQVNVPQPSNGQPDEHEKELFVQSIKAILHGRKGSINLSNQDFASHRDESLKALLAENQQRIDALSFGDALFQRGDVVVRISDAGDVPVPSHVSPERIRNRLAGCACFYSERMTDRGPRAVQEYPPKDVATAILHHHAAGFPELDAVVSHPVLVLDAKGVTRAVSSVGYDRESKLLLHSFDGDALPKSASQEQAVASRDWIKDEVLRDFPFSGSAERAHAYALIFLPFVRRVISGCTPLHMIEGSTRGSGKTLLNEVCASFSVVRGARSTMPPVRDDEEMRKRVTMVFGAAAEVVAFDNLTGKLDSPTLAALLTSEDWTDRLLGVNQGVRYRNTIIWTATANNLTLDEDIARRIVRIRLEPQVENPSMRKGFRHAELTAWMEAERATCLRHAWTCVLGWFQAGCPTVETPPMGSYQSWARTVGSLLAWLGVEGFLTNRSDVQTVSVADSAMLGAFVATWWERHGDQEVTSEQLLVVADEVEYPLRGETETSRRLSVTWSVRKLRGRWIDSYLVSYLPQDHKVGRKKATFKLSKRERF